MIRLELLLPSGGITLPLKRTAIVPSSTRDSSQVPRRAGCDHAAWVNLYLWRSRAPLYQLVRACFSQSKSPDLAFNAATTSSTDLRLFVFALFFIFGGLTSLDNIPFARRPAVG